MWTLFFKCVAEGIVEGALSATIVFFFFAKEYRGIHPPFFNFASSVERRGTASHGFWG